MTTSRLSCSVEAAQITSGDLIPDEKLCGAAAALPELRMNGRKMSRTAECSQRLDTFSQTCRDMKAKLPFLAGLRLLKGNHEMGFPSIA